MNVVTRVFRIPPVPERRDWLSRIAVRTFVCSLVVMIIIAGLLVRDWTWNNTRTIRFHGDIRNAYEWGSYVVQLAQSDSKKFGQPINWAEFFRAYWKIYSVTARNARGAQYDLDYPPLRLLVMSIWTKHMAETEPNLPGWRDDESNIVAPLLRFNTTMELLACVAAFLVVRHWHRECELAAQPSKPPSNKPWMLGAAAALLFWFNPAVLLDAHAWPQWDVWIVPAFLWAVYFAMLRRWFWVGVVLAIGAMLKGQLLAGAPVILLFALFRGQFFGLFRLLFGFALAGSIIVFPWLIKWEWDWYKIGFEYGTYHHVYMHAGVTYNLAAVLQASWGFTPRDLIEIFGGTYELRKFLIGIYAVLLVGVSIGAAVAHYRKDSRFLVALVTPWLLFFTISAQMHERYLIWFGVISCILIGQGLGITLLHLLTTGLACCQILSTMLNKDPGFAPDLHAFIDGLNPGAGFAMVVLAFLFMWQSMSAISWPKWRKSAEIKG